ncbi:isoprenylcysteine carboxylmethyltransferase family protein [Mycobacterium sp.]|uniref:methyltransferase family protein n=1 Tax=Mycobacterium sp. TaxID=1785 RepID=UPI001274E023|nr:isoprenylcysteine carboxylmethyltransferase family protein [Mycobacterium sp.]KAA8966015.1 MAG: isoprenylcysteine carboxylmethyltransferase family protein [Mycobacterium sp.]
MKSIPKIVLSELVWLVMFGVAVFLPAWTLAYWQAWVLLAVVIVLARIPGIYLLYTNPVALQRRTRGGPRAETRMVQKLVMGGLWFSLAAMLVVSALDHRFGWSKVPTALCLVGDVLVAVGLVLVMLVVVQNSYAGATVRVESDQKLVATGLYSLVRHPMYTGNVITMVGIPLALGSYWGLVFVVSGLTVLALRIRDEEELLEDELDGYREYRRTVRYRLLPRIW